MGYKLNTKSKNADNLTIFLDSIGKDCEQIEHDFLKNMEKTGKKIIENTLRPLRNDKLQKGRTLHLYQDVKSDVVTDSMGYSVLKFKGGKQTGTLWHIVNDGTYRTRPTHFIDQATEMIDEVAGEILDDAMKKVNK